MFFQTSKTQSSRRAGNQGSTLRLFLWSNLIARDSNRNVPLFLLSTTSNDLQARLKSMPRRSFLTGWLDYWYTLQQCWGYLFDTPALYPSSLQVLSDFVVLCCSLAPLPMFIAQYRAKEAYTACIASINFTMHRGELIGQSQRTMIRSKNAFLARGCCSVCRLVSLYLCFLFVWLATKAWRSRRFHVHFAFFFSFVSCNLYFPRILE